MPPHCRFERGKADPPMSFRAERSGPRCHFERSDEVPHVISSGAKRSREISRHHLGRGKSLHSALWRPLRSRRHYLRSVCSHRSTLLGAESSSCPKMCCGGFLHDHGGALLDKTARECAVVVVSAVTRAHYLAGILMLATKCAAMTTTLAHELEWPQRTCGTPPLRQHYRCRNHLSASFL